MRVTVIVALVAVAAQLAFAVEPAAAYGAAGWQRVGLDGGAATLDAAVGDRPAGEFPDVLARRDAPDSMCLSVLVGDRLVSESQSRRQLVPASLVKLATASAVLEVMAPDGTFKTEVVVRADALSSVADGVLKGDVYVVGGGDPVLSTPRYIGRFTDPAAHTDITKLADRVFAALSAHGVTRVEGRVVGDDSWFPDGERDYTDHRYGAAPDPAGAPEAVWKRSFVSANNVGPLSALLLNGGFSSYAWSTSSPRLNVRAPDPARHVASVFDDLLEAHGMVITNRPRSGLAPSSAERASLGFVESPPLSEILARMLSRSDNSIAEILFKEVGRRRSGSSRAAASASVQAIMRRQLGSLAEGLAVVDGSGLSSHNRLTCAAVAELLVQAGPGSPIVDGLAVPWESGTLRACGPGSPTANAIRAKTGTLNDATALAGMTTTPGGVTVTFAMMANSPNIISRGSCHGLRRSMLNAAARYNYVPEPEDPPQTGDREVIFGDTLGTVHAESIDFLAGLGVLEGSECSEGRICPERFIDRATMAVWLARSLNARGPSQQGPSESAPREGESAGLEHERFGWGEPAEVGEPRFDDVDPYAWWAPHVEHLAELGVTAGCSRSPLRYCPDRLVTRAQMATFLVRAFNLPDAEPAGFSDTGGVHADSIDRLAAAGVTAGCGRDPLRYCPDRSVTRAQMTAFLARALCGAWGGTGGQGARCAALRR